MSFHWGLHHKTHMFDHFNILLWWVGRNLIAKIGIHLEISFKKQPFAIATGQQCPAHGKIDENFKTSNGFQG